MTMKCPRASVKDIKLKMNHTVIASAMLDSNNSSRAEGFKLPDTIFLTSLLRLFRSDLYSRNLARSTALTFGCKLLASRSIFRIYKFVSTTISESQSTEEIKAAFHQKWGKKMEKEEEGTKASASSIPDFISETFCFFCSADSTERIQIIAQNILLLLQHEITGFNSSSFCW